MSHYPNFNTRLSLLAAAAALSSPLLPTALNAAPAASKISVYTPAPGSPERKEMMNALRGPFARMHHQQVVFQVGRLKAGNGYAYLDATALGTDGKPARELAPMGGSVSAFYRKQNGHWKVVKWGSYGGTDLVDYCRQHYPTAPHALFP